jgi:hypothetical protein
MSAAYDLLELAARRERQVDPVQAALNAARANRKRPRTSEEAGAAQRRRCARRQCKSPDRERSRGRRRWLASLGKIPAEMCRSYTEAERAVLTVIAREVAKAGRCGLYVEAIAAKAGCSVSSVHNALHEAKQQGHIDVTYRDRPGRKSLANVVRIISDIWRRWLDFKPERHPSVTGYKSKFLCTTKDFFLREGARNEDGGAVVRPVPHPPAGPSSVLGLYGAAARRSSLVVLPQRGAPNVAQQGE